MSYKYNPLEESEKTVDNLKADGADEYRLMFKSFLANSNELDNEIFGTGNMYELLEMSPTEAIERWKISNKKKPKINEIWVKRNSRLKYAVTDVGDEAVSLIVRIAGLTGLTLGMGDFLSNYCYTGKKLDSVSALMNDMDNLE